MKGHIGIFLILVLMTILSVQAQDLRQVSKKEVLERVSQHNHTIRIADKELQQARADYLQSRAVFLPQLSASYTGVSTNNPLMAFGSKLNQEIVRAVDFDPAALNDPDVIQNYATTIDVQQPIINVDGMYQRKAAKYTMNAKSLQLDRTREYLQFEVEKAYMDLQLAYKVVKVLEKALLSANENKRLSDNSYKQGYLQRADVLQVEVRVADVKNQLEQARMNVRNASNYLSFLMDDSNSSTIYQPIDSLSLVVLTQKEYRLSENRSDVQAMQLASKAYKAMHTSHKMEYLPRLNAFGSYQLYDGDFLAAGASGYVIGAQLKWDIFKGSQRKGKIQKSKSTYDKSQLEYEQYVSKNKLEINQARRMLEHAKNQLDLSKLAWDQSLEAYRIRTNRFKEGLEKTADLLMAETQLAQKELAYFQTVYQYNYTSAYLDFLTKK